MHIELSPTKSCMDVHSSKELAVKLQHTAQGVHCDQRINFERAVESRLVTAGLEECIAAFTSTTAHI